MSTKRLAIEPGTIQAAFRGNLGPFSLDASFVVPAKGVTAIFGASGSGKTTVARCLAGLHHLPGSFCAIDGDIWQNETTFRKTHQRPIGYVFQEASLFSHLTVKRNLLYGTPKDAQASSHDGIGYDEVIELLGLARLLDRSPLNLSGGERQRVAIGRALLSQPKLLLMDEPLSALDRSTKNEILPFLERLHARLSLPVFYISHDMSEIERLADNLVLMQHGQVVGAGPLQVLQSDPSLPLACAREAAVSLDATVEDHDPAYGLLTLRVRGGCLLVPAPPVAGGKRQRLRIAASDVSIARAAPDASSILNVLPARIVSKSLLGQGEVIVVLALGSDWGWHAAIGSDHASILGSTRTCRGHECLRTGQRRFAGVQTRRRGLPACRVAIECPGPIPREHPDPGSRRADCQGELSRDF